MIILKGSDKGKNNVGERINCGLFLIVVLLVIRYVILFFCF